MGQIGNWLQWESLMGRPVVGGGRTVTPVSQTVNVRFPSGGWVWNRPVAVLVESEEGTERLPIVDATRLGMIGASAAAAGLALLIWLLVRPRA